MIGSDVWFFDGLKVNKGKFEGYEDDLAVIKTNHSRVYYKAEDRPLLWDFEEGDFLEMRLNSNIEGDVT